MEALKANGIDDNTLVMFTTDNGGAGYIGLPEINQPFRGWKMTFFEGGIHVPYFMRWPARIKPGSKFEAPTHIDKTLDRVLAEPVEEDPEVVYYSN